MTFVAGPPGVDPHASDAARIHAGPFDQARSGVAAAIQIDVSIYLPRSEEAAGQSIETFSSIGLSCVACVNGKQRRQLGRNGGPLLVGCDAYVHRASMSQKNKRVKTDGCTF